MSALAVARRPMARGLAAVLLVAGLALAGCSSDSKGSDAGDKSTTTTPKAGDDATTTTPVTDQLMGGWTADASAIIAANLANLGGASGISCSGPITLTFAEGGEFSQTGVANCTVAGVSGEAAFDSTGAYEVDGNELVISDAASTGEMTLNGTSAPLNAGLSNGRVEFELSDDTLVLSFTMPDVGDVVQTYVRA